MDEVTYDQDGTIIRVPAAQITAGLDSKDDGSYYFQLLGGPYHDKRVRVYPPFSTIVFRNENIVYEICPPRTKTGNWCYIHNPELNAQDYPSQVWDQAQVDAQWAAHGRYLATKKRIAVEDALEDGSWMK